jgi:coenzyme F420-reducing hydrogenase alpha subunit
MANKIIQVNYISRVEGRGALDITLSDSGNIENLQLRIYEPPRFFEAFMIGRRCDEVMELASRICGICPVAHQITALRAIENALDITPSDQTKDLRKLLAISAHIQSNVLSMYFLSLPDLMKYESIITMAQDHPEVIKRGLRLKQMGNDITDLIGGRAVHPITAVIGGFTTLPKKEQLQAIRQRLIKAKQDAEETVDLFSEIEKPVFHRKCEHMALSNPKFYAINEGRLRSTKGLNIRESEYREYITEKQVPYSTALHSYMKTRDTFMVGPLPRLNLNLSQMSSDAKNAARRCGIKIPNFNPFNSHLARAIELVHDIDESIEIIDRLTLRKEKLNYHCKAGFGAAITEAPRGTLYHSYLLDNNGIVKKADLVPPTSHNAQNIENDMYDFVQQNCDLPTKDLTLKCEMLIRAYDPCISCSTH